MSSREVNIRTLQRSWARRPKFAIPLSRPADAQVQYSCPTCGSENTQRLSTAYMEGVSQFSATTSGFGWVGGPAVAKGWTTGHVKRRLPRSLPRRRSEVIESGSAYCFSSPVIGPAPFAFWRALNGFAQIYEILPPYQFWHWNSCTRFAWCGLYAQQDGMAEALREWQRCLGSVVGVGNLLHHLTAVNRAKCQLSRGSSVRR